MRRRFLGLHVQALVTATGAVHHEPLVVPRSEIDRRNIREADFRENRREQLRIPYRRMPLILRQKSDRLGTIGKLLVEPAVRRAISRLSIVKLYVSPHVRQDN